MTEKKYPVIPKVIVREDEYGSISYWAWDQPTYAPILLQVHNIDFIVLDFGTIRDRDEWVPAHWDEIREWLDTHGYESYELKGHGQNAKTGLMPLIHKDHHHMFEGNADVGFKEAIRLGLLLTPCQYGITVKESILVMFVGDDYPGCGDGYGGAAWLPNPWQFRATMFLDGKFEHGIGLKGQLGNTVHIPEGVDMVLPESVVKGRFAKKLLEAVKEGEHPIVRARVRMGYVSQATANHMRLGYMISQYFPDHVFKLMEKDTIRAIEEVKHMREDPLAFIDEEEVLDGDEERGVDMLDTGETQGINGLLPALAKHYARTGDKSLLQSKTVAILVQNRIAQKCQDAFHTGGVLAQSARFMPIPASMHGKAEEGTIYLNPHFYRKYRKTGLANVHRHPSPSFESGVGVKVKADSSIPLYNDAGAKVCYAAALRATLKRTGVDADGDALAIMHVPSEDSWQYAVHEILMLLSEPSTGGDRVENKQPPKSYMEAWCNATAADVGVITNVITRLVALRQYVGPEWYESIDNILNGVEPIVEKGKKTTMQVLWLGQPAQKVKGRVIEVGMTGVRWELQAAVDAPKHGAKPNKEMIKTAKDLLKKLDFREEDAAYHSLLGKAEDRSWAFNRLGQFNPKPGDRISKRTSLGRHIRKFEDMVPAEPFADIKSNSFFKDRMRARKGRGYDAGEALWQKMSKELSHIKEMGYQYEEAKALRAQIGKWWTNMWADLATGNQKYLEQAVSAVWKQAFEKDDRNQNRLWSTHLPTIFRLLEQDLKKKGKRKPKDTEDIAVEGRLIGIGLKNLAADTMMQVIGIREGKNKEQQVHQFVLTKDNPEMGWMVVGATLPEDFKGKLRVKPATNASSSFQTW